MRGFSGCIQQTFNHSEMSHHAHPHRPGRESSVLFLGVSCLGTLEEAQGRSSWVFVINPWHSIVDDYS